MVLSLFLLAMVRCFFSNLTKTAKKCLVPNLSYSFYWSPVSDANEVRNKLAYINNLFSSLQMNAGERLHSMQSNQSVIEELLQAHAMLSHSLPSAMEELKQLKQAAPSMAATKSLQCLIEEMKPKADQLRTALERIKAGLPRSVFLDLPLEPSSSSKFSQQPTPSLEDSVLENLNQFELLYNEVSITKSFVLYTFLGYYFNRT